MGSCNITEYKSLNLEIMKKLFFTLAVCWFSMGAFAFNGNSNGNNSSIIGTETVHQIPEMLSLNCTIEVTYVITIDHGLWIETITIVVIEPCPIGY